MVEISGIFSTPFISTMRLDVNHKYFLKISLRQEILPVSVGIFGIKR
jgi:hypothetical protein